MWRLVADLMNDLGMLLSLQVFNFVVVEQYIKYISLRLKILIEVGQVQIENLAKQKKMNCTQLIRFCYISLVEDINEKNGCYIVCRDVDGPSFPFVSFSFCICCLLRELIKIIQ